MHENISNFHFLPYVYKQNLQYQLKIKINRKFMLLLQSGAFNLLFVAWCSKEHFLTVSLKNAPVHQVYWNDIKHLYININYNFKFYLFIFYLFTAFKACPKLSDEITKTTVIFILKNPVVYPTPNALWSLIMHF